jgi:hypothetical protein
MRWPASGHFRCSAEQRPRQNGARSVTDRAPSSSYFVLVGLLALFGRCGTGSSSFSFGFLLGGITLRMRLVLLSLALVLEVFVTEHAADGFFG